jgi:hypothetical protein
VNKTPRVGDKMRDRDVWVFYLAMITSLVILLTPIATITLYPSWIYEFWGSDFKAYFLAGRRVLGGLDLYVTEYQIQPPVTVTNSGFMKYLYPPITIFSFFPFILPPFRIGLILFNVTSIFAISYALLLLLSEFEIKLQKLEIIVLLFILVSFMPVFSTIRLGQVSLFLSTFAILAGVGLERQLDSTSDSHYGYISGILTVAIAIVKPNYRFASAHTLLNKKRFFAVFITGAVITTLSFVVFGIDIHRSYLEFMISGTGGEQIVGGVTSVVGSGLNRFVPYRVFGRYWYISYAIVFISTVALGLVGYINSEDRLIYCLGVIVVPLLAGNVSTKHYLIALPGFLMLWNYDHHHKQLFQPLFPLIFLFQHLQVFYTHNKLLPNVLPRLVPEFQWLFTSGEPLYALFQPGLWAILIGMLITGYYILNSNHG